MMYFKQEYDIISIIIFIPIENYFQHYLLSEIGINLCHFVMEGSCKYVLFSLRYVLVARAKMII